MPTTLAQIFDTVDPLTGGSVVDVWLLERSTFTAMLVAGIALVVAASIARSSTKRGLIALAVGAALAAGIYAVGSAIETGREAIRDATQRFVSAIAEGDASTAASLVSDRLVISSGGVGLPQGAPFVRTAASTVPRLLDRYRVRHRGQALDGPDLGRSRFMVNTEGGDGPLGGRSITGWEMTWRRQADGSWHAVALDCLLVNGRQPGSDWIRWID